MALALLGVGVSMIVNASRDEPETVMAQVRAVRISDSGERLVKFHFADSGDDEVSADDSQSLFEAVAEFGGGTARVTRNAHGHSIRSVKFHRKTYDINSPSDDRRAGIIGVGLGLLVLVFVIVSRYFPLPDDAGSEAKSQSGSATT